jgi:hypothetical protein
MAAVDPTNPQSWNRYAYVANNPLALIDPQGLAQACSAASQSGGICNWDGSANGGSTSGAVPPWLTLQFWDPNLPFWRYDVLEGGAEGGWLFVNLFSSGGPCSYVLANPCGGGAKNPQKPVDRYDQCISSMNNSPVGKTARFFSVTGLVTNFVEWLTLGGVKTGAIYAMDQAESVAAVTDYSITAGTTAAPATLAGSTVLGYAGLGGMTVATIVEGGMARGCQMATSPSPLDDAL